MYSTGHPVGDLLVPAALQLVAAVRQGDQGEVMEAYASASKASDNPYWPSVLTLVLAALVPDDRKPSELLAWCTADRDMYLRLREKGFPDREAAAMAGG